MPEPERKRRKPAPAKVQAAVKHRRAMVRVVDRQAVAGLRDEFDRGAAELERSLAEDFRGRRRDLSSAHLVHEVSTRVSDGLVLLFGSVAGALAAQTADVAVEGVRRLATFFSAVREGAPSPLDDPRRAEVVAMARVPELERMRVAAVGVAGADASAAVRLVLAELPIGEATVDGVISTAMDAADAQWWKVERVARTEASRAFNAAQDEGIARLGMELPGLRKRWTEMVSDLTGEPMDDAVGKDSLVLHGQIAGPDGMFTMPDDPLAPMRMVGMSWAAPPNRPNCRAVLQPWHPDWDIPAWVFRDGERVELT